MTFSHEPPLTRREARLREEARQRTGESREGAARGVSTPDAASAGADLPSPVQPASPAPRPDPSETPKQSTVPAAFSRRAGRAERERNFTQSNPVITPEMQAAAEAESIARAEALAMGEGALPGAVPPPTLSDRELASSTAAATDEPSGDEDAPQSRPLTRRELRERELRKNKKAAPIAPEAPEASLTPLSVTSSESVTFNGETVPLFSPAREEDAPLATPEFGSVPGLRGVDSAPEPLQVPDTVWAEPAEDDELVAKGKAGVDGELLASFTSGSALTTSALVLPTIPIGDVTRPFNNTGEILITGSIDLPRSLASRGLPSAQFENTELDSLFAGEDAEAPSDSSPVRASKAVSSHTSTHDVISVKKPVSHRLPVVLMVTAIVLAVGVAALAVVGVVTGVF